MVNLALVHPTVGTTGFNPVGMWDTAEVMSKLDFSALSWFSVQDVYTNVPFFTPVRTFTTLKPSDLIQRMKPEGRGL